MAVPWWRPTAFDRAVFERALRRHGDACATRACLGSTRRHDAMVPYAGWRGLWSAETRHLPQTSPSAGPRRRRRLPPPPPGQAPGHGPVSCRNPLVTATVGLLQP